MERVVCYLSYAGSVVNSDGGWRVKWLMVGGDVK